MTHLLKDSILQKRKYHNDLHNRRRLWTVKVESDRTNPFDLLLIEIGVDRKNMPALTNGDLMRIAEVDIPTLHGWQYLNRELPEDALQRLRDHFIQYRNK